MMSMTDEAPKWEWQDTACDDKMSCHCHSPVQHFDPRIKLASVSYVCAAHGGDVRCAVCKRRGHSQPKT